MTADTLDWMDFALCAGMRNFTELDQDDQKKMCAQCSVRNDCLRLGLSIELCYNERDGVVYGGLTTTERRKLLNKRGANR